MVNLLSAIRESSSLKSITNVDLRKSNFDSEEACKELALFVAQAPTLEELNLLGQTSQKKIKVKVFPAQL